MTLASSNQLVDNWLFFGSRELILVVGWFFLASRTGTPLTHPSPSVQLLLNPLSTKMASEFQQKNTFEKRLAESTRIREKCKRCC